MPLSSKGIWDQDAQQSFFSLLKSKNKIEQGESILAKAEELIHHKNCSDDLLKGAESLLNMYTLKYRNPENEERATRLLGSIYTKLGEEEKATRFLK